MKIYSVEVDKLPDGCGSCPLGVDIGGSERNEYICAGLPEECNGFPDGMRLPEMTFRRHDCPLREPTKSNPYAFCQRTEAPAGSIAQLIDKLRGNTGIQRFTFNGRDAAVGFRTAQHSDGKICDVLVIEDYGLISELFARCMIKFKEREAVEE